MFQYFMADFVEPIGYNDEWFYAKHYLDRSQLEAVTRIKFRLVIHLLPKQRSLKSSTLKAPSAWRRPYKRISPKRFLTNGSRRRPPHGVHPWASFKQIASQQVHIAFNNDFSKKKIATTHGRHLAVHKSPPPQNSMVSMRSADSTFQFAQKFYRFSSPSTGWIYHILTNSIFFLTLPLTHTHTHEFYLL